MELSNDLLAGAEAAAQHCGLPARAIYHLVETGRLPVIKKGRRLFFLKSELNRAFTPEA